MRRNERDIIFDDLLKRDAARYSATGVQRPYRQVRAAARTMPIMPRRDGERELTKRYTNMPIYIRKPARKSLLSRERNILTPPQGQL